MIHHISISANNPLHVAQVIAELWQGEVMPFPEHEGSYMALSYDSYGSLILVLPKGAELLPRLSSDTDDASEFTHNPHASAYTATHAAISVPVSESVIWEIAAREGWHAVHCDRQDFFEVIELWLENQVLLELLPPTIAPKYLAFMQPESLKQFSATLSETLSGTAS
jgi:hypothetical protein